MRGWSRPFKKKVWYSCLDKSCLLNFVRLQQSPIPKREQMYHFVSIVKSLKNDSLSEQLSQNYFIQKNVSLSGLTNFLFNYCCEREVGQWLSKTVLMDQ